MPGGAKSFSYANTITLGNLIPVVPLALAVIGGIFWLGGLDGRVDRLELEQRRIENRVEVRLNRIEGRIVKRLDEIKANTKDRFTAGDAKEAFRIRDKRYAELLAYVRRIDSGVRRLERELATLFGRSGQTGNPKPKE